MKHHKSIRKFGRVRNQRTALMRGLARSLILHEKIITTEAKAKELRPYVEKLITLAKTDSVARRRLIDSKLGGQPQIVAKLISKVAPKYADRSGGYTRVIKLGKSGSDAASRATIELV